MRGIDDYAVDRAGWVRGEWDEEPDLLRWDAEGHPCALVRNPLGAWCGYVGLYPKHPDYDKRPHELDEVVNVHCGVTYAGDTTAGLRAACALRKEEVALPSTFWVGFDCAHGGTDLFPCEPEFITKSLDKAACFYKTMAWAKTETERLAYQLRKRATSNLWLVD